MISGGTPIAPPQSSVQLSAQPALGAEWTATIPAGQWWKVELAFATFSTSAAAGNRFPGIRILDAVAGNIVFEASEGTPIPAIGGLAVRLGYTARSGYGMLLGTGTVDQDVSLPDIWLPPGFVIQSLTSGILGGDQYSAVRGLVRVALQQPGTTQ